MRLFADENTPRVLVLRLREWGHDVVDAPEVAPGADDRHWLTLAEAEGRVILTSDKDFGDLVFRDHRTTHGVILLRLEDLALPERVARLAQVWPIIAAHPSGRFIVIAAHKIRVRNLNPRPDSAAEK